MIWSPIDAGSEKVGNTGGDPEAPDCGNQMENDIAD